MLLYILPIGSSTTNSSDNGKLHMRRRRLIDLLPIGKAYGKIAHRKIMLEGKRSEPY